MKDDKTPVYDDNVYTSQLKWPEARYGQEQSPIELYRIGINDTSKTGFKKVIFEDSELLQKYGSSNLSRMGKAKVDFPGQNMLWTGTQYQVALNYYTDFLRTKCVNLFESKYKLKKGISNFTTRGVQFHFHNPSEHIIEGNEFDLELHIVHKLMYVQKKDQHLFDKWSYAVTALFF